MYKEKAITIFTQASKNVALWNAAIKDARKLMKRETSPRRLAGLLRAIVNFEELRDSGMPFPGEGAKRSEVGA